jgi:thiamine pyrophosphate-dependent acetolactate synthase large subunit-like protein
MMEGSVSDVLLAILKKHGVRYICGLPAAQIGLVMHGASRDPDLTYVTTRHEEAAGHMAHAISRVTQTMGVCFATVGPGATNLLPGVAAAFADNIPLLAITGQNQAAEIDPSRDQLQSADQLGLFRSVTKWNASIHHAERAPELVERAVHIARSGRPGPVHLDIPCDVGTQLCRYDLNTVPTFRLARPIPSPGELQRAADALLAARKPLLLAGGGVARSGATESFRTLLERTGFPAVSTIMGRGVLPPESPYNIGAGGLLAGQAVIDATQNADVILAVGCKFGTFTPINKPPSYPKPDGQIIIQIDIDSESIGKSAPIDIGLVGDADATLHALLELLGQEVEPRAESEWLGALRDKRRDFRDQVNATASAKVVGGGTVLNEAAVASAISELIPADAITVIDGGQAMVWGTTFIQADHPNRILSDPGMGHLGFGLPFANAAKLAHPDRPVVCITGDGALGCTVQELETAARYGLNIIVLVFNDSHWGMYKPFGEVLGNPDFGTQLTKVDFAKVAEGFGCRGWNVTTLDALPTAFGQAVQAGRPAVIDIEVEYTPHPMDFMWPNIILHGFQFPERDKMKAVA